MGAIDSCSAMWLIPRGWFSERGVVWYGGAPSGRWISGGSGAGREAMWKRVW